MNIKRTTIRVGGITSVLAMLLSQAAYAQAPMDEVVTTGIKRSLKDARNQKRNSAGVLDAIAAKEIGQLPDTNLAESLQRITGVSIDRSGGEGQFITVRGFGPEFNTVLVNGRQIASEDLGRAFAFDTISSDLVSNIQVNKTSSATMQSGGIGSTVNISTARPLDTQGFRATGSIGGSYDENSKKFSPNISGVVSNTSDDGTFGVLGSFAYQERSGRLDQMVSGGWIENSGIPQSEINGGAGYSGNTFIPRNLDAQVQFQERKRINGNLVFQYAPTDDLEVTIDGLYSDFDVNSDVAGFGHWFTGSNVENVTLDENGTVVDVFQQTGLATDFERKRFDRLTETYALGLNVEKTLSDSLKGSFDAHYSKATRDANNGGEDGLAIVGYANRVRYQLDGNTPYFTMFDTPDASVFSGEQEATGNNVVGVNTPAGVQGYLDPSNTRGHVMLRRGWQVEDEVTQLRGDLTWDQGDDVGLTSLRGGMQFSDEVKNLVRFDNEGQGFHCSTCGYRDNPLISVNQTVFDAGDNFLSGLSGSENLTTQWLTHDYEGLFSFVEGFSGNDLDAQRRGNSFDVNEQTLSAYVESDWAGDIGDLPFSAVMGARLEKTDVTVNGTNEGITGLIIVDATEMTQQRTAPEAVSFDNSYTTLLPNMTMRLDASDDLVLRLGASQTITRPTLTSLSPVLNITTTRQGGDLRAEGGNPDLKPFKSDNIDLSAEYYYGDENYFSIGVFHKEVSNFIVTGQGSETITTTGGTPLLDPSTDPRCMIGVACDFGDVAQFTVARPINGDDAAVTGIEVALQHAFGDSGFGIQLNGTWVDGSVKLDPADLSQIFALTGLSNSANAVGYYDKGPIELRVAWNWRDKFLQSLSQIQGNGVTNVAAYQQIDFSAKYSINENIDVYAEGINLTNEIQQKYGRFRNHFLSAEDSGRRLNVGARFTF